MAIDAQLDLCEDEDIQVGVVNGFSVLSRWLLMESRENAY